MAVVTELIRKEDNGTLSFGDYTLPSKTKLEDFAAYGNIYKVKTFKELTRLERDGALVYESEPGTSVNDYKVLDNGVSFTVSGDDDAMITVGVSEDTEYNVTVGERNVGIIKSGISGKINISVELAGKGEVAVLITK